MTLIEPRPAAIRWLPDSSPSKPHLCKGRWARKTHLAPRTLADALAALESSGALVDEGQARIRTARVQRPDGRIVTSVAVTAAHQGPGCGVVMPAADVWRAKTTLGALIQIEVEHLEGATADLGGNVRLRDGTYLHALEAVPIPLAETLSPQQEAILHHALCYLGAEAQCYRPLDETQLPGVVVLDYAAVAKLGKQKHGLLKKLAGYVADRMPHVSRQTIASALALAGLRPPHAGSRARRCQRRGKLGARGGEIFPHERCGERGPGAASLG